MSSGDDLTSLSPDQKRALLRRLLAPPQSTLDDAFPLSHGQGGLWHLRALAPESAAYNTVFTLDLRGPVRAAALQRAFAALVARHPALRTTYTARNGEPLQRVSPDLVVPLLIRDASKLDEPALLRAIDEETARPFDFEKGPLVWASLYQRSAEQARFVLCAHHIAVDFWSAAVLFDELGTLYRSELRSEAAQLPAAAASYRDFVRWQAERLASPEGQRQRHYWLERFDGGLPRLELPTDRPRPAVQTLEGAWHTFSLPAGLVADLRQLASAQDTTLFTVALSGYFALLHRLSGQQDLVVASPTSGRNRPELDGLVGFLANPVALFARVEPDALFSRLVTQVRDVVLGALEHGDFPFQLLLQELQPARGTGHPPLAQVGFAWDKPQGDALDTRWGEVEVRWRGGQQRGAPYDVTFAVLELGDSLTITVLYNTALFDADTIERMGARYLRLLDAAVTRPDLAVGALPLSSEAERELLLRQWNRTRTAYPREATIHSLFEEQARRTPDRVAVESPSASLTYAELDRRANGLAVLLRRRGVRDEARVGVRMERGPDALVALLGILKAGGAYVPLDPSSPPERLARLVEEAGVQLILEDGSPLGEPALAAPPDPAHPRGLAYVMFTSGSTGEPKGICVEHRGVIRLVRDTDYVRLDPEIRVLHAAPLAFDASTFEIWGALLNGGRLVVAPPGALSLAGLGRAVRQGGVDTLWLTAALYHQMVDARLEDLRGVRQLIVGGDVVSASHTRRALEALPGTAIVNGYGPTENTTFTACHRIGMLPPGRSVPIGRPIANTRVFVLDPRLEPAPVGVPGELYAAGDGLARGYLGRADLTAASFIPDPFSGEPGARMYRTGDLARWRPDGQLEFLGRRDGQVKVRGFRIELAEVEGVLAAHPDVAHTAVQLRRDQDAGGHLVGYVVPRDRAAPTEDDLRTFLAAKLPPYMIPTRFVTLAALPLNRNGKVDRRALPDPEPVHRADTEGEAPLAGQELAIAKVWSEVLGQPRIGRQDNFFALGGHSLLATRVLARLHEHFGVELPFRALFDWPTVAQLAEALRQSAGAGATPAVAVPAAGENAGTFPLTGAQRHLWTLSQLRPGSPAYNIPLALRLQGTLDVEALRRSLEILAQRHGALRASFAGPATDSAGDEPRQLVVPAVEVPFSLVDLQQHPEAERPRHARALAAALAREPLDVTRAPLWRVALLRIGPDEHWLVAVFHHLIFDGGSLAILLRELRALYEGLRAGHAPDLPTSDMHSGTLALLEKQGQDGQRTAAGLDHWRRRLAGVPALQLPTDRPRPAERSDAGATCARLLPAQLRDQLDRLGQRYGASRFMTLLAAYLTLLHRYSGQVDLTVGTPVEGRARREREEVLGTFVNTVVLRGDLSADPPFEVLLQRVREATLEDFGHQDVPWDRVVSAVDAARDPSRTPLFQAMLVVQPPGSGLTSFELCGLHVEPVDVHSGTAKFDLTLAVSEVPGGLACLLEYSTALYEPATAERLLRHFEQLLRSIASTPERPLSRLPMLPEEERATLLARGAVRAASFGGGLLHARFEAQARVHPESLAVQDEGEGLTYGALNRRANRLARRLRALGITPGAHVALALERGTSLVTAILATLKAGAAYVPLDPAHAVERLRFQLRDCGAQVLLTDEANATRLDGQGLRVVCLPPGGEEDAGPGGDSDRDPDLGVPPDATAYIIYTSGSTGQPKGTPVSHRNVTRLFDATQEWFGFDHRDVWSCFHSCAFDFSVWEMWGALTYGGRLVWVPREVTRSPARFYELLCEAGVTVLSQTPSAFRQLIAAEGEAGGRPELALRLVIFGGEALDPRSLKPWMDRHGDERPRLINMYGITETTVHVTYRPMTRTDAQGRGASLIGVPIPDLGLCLLDLHGEPVPEGVPGELYVRGAGLAQGYLGRPELTASRFVPDPFGDGSRLYRSGDLARWCGDDLEYLGRADHQVKVRGFRIEPGEIEAVLRSHPGVTDAAVTARPDPHGELRLIAYVAPPVAPDELRSHLASRLPDYMIPAAFVGLDTLPLTVNGKLDRAALPEPGSERPSLATDYQPPRTPAERILAEVWSELLGTESPGLDDNFFALGGDSLRAIRLRTLARARKLTFDVGQVFQHQTIRELAAVARSTGAASPGLAPAPEAAPSFSLLSAADRAVVPAGVEEAYPLATLQAGMLVESARRPGSTAYRDVYSLHLRAPCEGPTFEHALRALVRRHPALRTTFDLLRYSEPVQAVLREVEVSVPVTDLRELSGVGQEAALAAEMEAERQRPFDPAKAPQLRARLLRRGDDRFQLLLSFNHAILDGWSVASLLTELLREYLARVRGHRPDLLTPPRARYTDFLQAEREAIGSAETAAFWQRLLAGADVAPLPRRPEGSPGAPARTGVAGAILDPDVLQRLEALARAEGVPLKSVLLGAHLFVLGLMTGSRDVVSGLVVNGRPEGEDGDRVLGLFLNTVPLRLSLDEGRGTWRELIRASFAAEMRLQPHRRYPLAVLSQARGGIPFEAIFNYAHFHIYDRLAGLGDALEVLDGQFYEETEFPLLVSCGIQPPDARLHLRLTYDASLLDAEQVGRFVSYYTATLGEIARRPDASFHGFSPLPESERALLQSWNETGAPGPEEDTLHGLIERQAARTPEAIAVRCGGQRLTYAELDARAARLARSLRALGAGPEKRVALCLERTPELVVALLGILKSGAAYVPLDPAYPPARLQVMLEDSGAELVLTRSHLASVLPPSPARRVDLDGALAAPEDSEAPEAPEARVGAQNLAYLIFTSGSTGRPKAVAIPHASAAAFLGWAKRTYPPEQLAGVLASTSVCFDLSVFELFLPLCTGGTVILVRDLLQLAELTDTSDLTLINTVPSAAAALLERGALPRSARTINLAGEPLPTRLVAALYEAGVERVYDLYGPSEYTTYTTVALRRADGPAVIGRPIDNTRVYVLDAALQPAPIGVPGELYLGGAGLARGYLGWPGLTAERFVPDPFSARPGARLYRTGDLVRHLPGGDLQFLGRADHQVKLRGFRIEPGEVEAHLEKHPAVSECVLAVRPLGTGEPGLIAWVVLRPGASDAAWQLRDHLRERLPAFMVPSAFIPLDRLPRTPNGKIDRGALPTPGPTAASPRTPFVAPESELEQAIAAVWRQCLNVEHLGVRDNFFDVGGTSLLMLRAQGLLQRALGRTLPLVSLFAHPNIRALARLFTEGEPVDDLGEAQVRAQARRTAAAARTRGGQQT